MKKAKKTTKKTTKKVKAGNVTIVVNNGSNAKKTKKTKVVSKKVEEKYTLAQVEAKVKEAINQLNDEANAEMDKIENNYRTQIDNLNKIINDKTNEINMLKVEQESKINAFKEAFVEQKTASEALVNEIANVKRRIRAKIQGIIDKINDYDQAVKKAEKALIGSKEEPKDAIEETTEQIQNEAENITSEVVDEEASSEDINNVIGEDELTEEDKQDAQNVLNAIEEFDE